MSLRETFRSCAREYDRARPDYPPELREQALSGLQKSGLRMLEIGAGSGLATELFADAASELIALDPSGELLALARERLRDRHEIEYRAETFEDARLPSSHFDLVLAAQSFHWIAEVSDGLSKVASVLRPGGRLVLAWNFVRFEGERRLAEIRDAILEAVPEFRRWPEASDESLAKYGVDWEHAVSDCESFGAVRRSVVERVWRRAPEGVCEWLDTLSWFRILDATSRDALLEGARRSLDGGAIDVPLQTLVVTATRR